MNLLSYKIDTGEDKPYSRSALLIDYPLASKESKIGKSDLRLGKWYKIDYRGNELFAQWSWSNNDCYFSFEREVLGRRAQEYYHVTVIDDKSYTQTPISAKP